MNIGDNIKSRCPFWDKIFSLLMSIILFLNSNPYPIMSVEIIEPEENIGIVEDIQESEPIIKEVVECCESSIDNIEIEKEFIQVSEPVEENIEIVELKSDEEIISEINVGLWGNGSEREKNLIAAGYNYEEIQSKINEQYYVATAKKEYPMLEKSVSYLTKLGGVYINPNTGLKETWYSQRVLPGGGLDIPGRHVNEEGIICDGDGYICISSSTYEKGTIIETSRGIGKVYDSGCAQGTLDIYVDW